MTARDRLVERECAAAEARARIIDARTVALGARPSAVEDPLAGVRGHDPELARVVGRELTVLRDRGEDPQVVVTEGGSVLLTNADGSWTHEFGPTPAPRRGLLARLR